MRVQFHILTLVLCLLVMPANAKDTLLDIQEVESLGGIKAWLVQDHSVPVIAMNISFRHAGSAYDPEDKQGLARMLSNTLDEGAGNIKAKDFQKELRDLSISLRYSAGRDHFGGSLKTLTKNKDRAFELLKLSLTEPRFDPEAIERMREANKSRIRSSLSDPRWMAARLLNDKAFDGHPYARNSGGTLSSLDDISRAYLKKFHNTHIGKNNIVVAVAGDITADQLKPLLDEVFGDLPEVEVEAAPELKLQNSGESFVYEHDVPQTVIQIVQPGIARDNPDYHIAQIMNFILGSSGFGSRLMEEIREKRGLTYGIYSSLYDYEQVELLSISTSTANDNVEEMLKLIRAELDKMITSSVTEKELQDAKSYLIGSLPLSLTSTDKIAGLLLSLQLDELPVDYLDVRKKAIEATTITDVKRVAEDILNPGALMSIMVGGIATPEEATRVKDLPNVE